MSPKLVGVAFVATVLIVVGAASTYTVGEYEQVIVTEFGKIEYTVSAPGLHVKVPFLQTVNRFDKRWLDWNGNPDQIPTKDKKFIEVDIYARWRVADPVLFFKNLRDEQRAQSRLDDIIDGELRTAIANEALLELVRTSSREFERSEEERELLDSQEFAVKHGRLAVTQRVTESAALKVASLGVELSDVRIKRISYEASVQTKVFDRMISERNRIAARYRSEGQGKSAETLGKIDRDLKKIESEAYKKSEELSGAADAEAATIYADAYNRDPELYQFLKTLEAYESAIDKDTVLVLSTDSEVLKYLKSEK